MAVAPMFFFLYSFQIDSRQKFTPTFVGFEEFCLFLDGWKLFCHGVMDDARGFCSFRWSCVEEHVAYFIWSSSFVRGECFHHF